MNGDSFLEYHESSSMFHGSMSGIMGTRFDILIIEKNRMLCEVVWGCLVAELTRLDRMLNRFDSASEISRVNRQAKTRFVCVSDELWLILRHCGRYHRLTSGLFDVTKKDFAQVAFRGDDQSVSFLSDGISFDLGGFAKGYALLKLKEILLKNRMTQCFVDFGNSSILGIGTHPYGDSWRVSIENPFRKGEILDEFTLRNNALSVSGNTPQYTEHIVNPLSGESVKTPRAVSVVAPDPLDAEVLTTALMVASPDEKTEILKRFDVEKASEYNFAEENHVEKT